MVDVDSLSLRVFYIEMFQRNNGEDRTVASGSSFLLRTNTDNNHSPDVVLITNWHNVTGLHRDTGEPNNKAKKRETNRRTCASISQESDD